MVSLGQAPAQSLHIQITYQKEGGYLEQAVATIEATNKLGRATKVEYRAGKSVVLLPGFEAHAGTVFVANIKPVEGTDAGSQRLQLTAFPNPFDQSTAIDYVLPVAGKVNLWIVDTQGKVIDQLVLDENQEAGKHRIEWQPKSLSAGLYIPIVEANQQKATTRIVKK